MLNSGAIPGDLDLEMNLMSWGQRVGLHVQHYWTLLSRLLVMLHGNVDCLDGLSVQEEMQPGIRIIYYYWLITSSSSSSSLLVSVSVYKVNLVRWIFLSNLTFHWGSSVRIAQTHYTTSQKLLNEDCSCTVSWADYISVVYIVVFCVPLTAVHMVHVQVQFWAWII